MRGTNRITYTTRVNHNVNIGDQLVYLPTYNCRHRINTKIELLFNENESQPETMFDQVLSVRVLDKKGSRYFRKIILKKMFLLL